MGERNFIVNIANTAQLGDDRMWAKCAQKEISKFWSASCKQIRINWRFHDRRALWINERSLYLRPEDAKWILKLHILSVLVKNDKKCKKEKFFCFVKWAKKHNGMSIIMVIFLSKNTKRELSRKRIRDSFFIDAFSPDTHSSKVLSRGRDFA